MQMVHGVVTLTVLNAETLSDDERADGYNPGDTLVEVTMHGYPLTKSGKRAQNKNLALDTGYRDEQTRWEIRRALVQASLDRHGIDPVTVVGASPLIAWDEHRAKTEAVLLARFGITR